jgi:small GTP-binding protein
MVNVRDELDQVILSFKDIQAEINYQQSQKLLCNLISNLDLTAEEQTGLETEIERLAGMLDKLEQSIIQISVFGMVGRGKSSVLNALLGNNIFLTGPLHGVTRSIETANWTLSQENIGLQQKSLFKLILPTINNSQIQLIDTPGIDEIDGETRTLLAQQIAEQSDLILFVISGDITKVEFEALYQLREVGKPIILVFNKIDQYPETDRLLIYEKITNERVKELISPEEIVMVAASPLQKQAIRDASGKITIKYIKCQPQIEDLKLKILEILEREGKALLALNSMLFADNINEKIVQRKMLIRENTADQIIQKTVMTKAGAIALNPVTIIDIFSGAIIDVAMIITLSRLYNLQITHQGAVKLLRQIALSMGGISASELLATLGLSGIKSMLGITAPLTGGLSLAPYLAIAITQGSIAGVSTFVIGQITKIYLANGASWGEESPKIVVKKILNSLDEKSILNRIKYELTKKIKPF